MVCTSSPLQAPGHGAQLQSGGVIDQQKRDHDAKPTIAAAAMRSLLPVWAPRSKAPRKLCSSSQPRALFSEKKLRLENRLIVPNVSDQQPSSSTSISNTISCDQ